MFEVVGSLVIDGTLQTKPNAVVTVPGTQADGILVYPSFSGPLEKAVLFTGTGIWATRGSGDVPIMGRVTSGTNHLRIGTDGGLYASVYLMDKSMYPQATGMISHHVRTPLPIPR